MRILYFLFLYMNIISAFKMLTRSKWNILDNYIRSHDTTDSMRNKINYILFKRHIPFVHSMVNEFRNLHKHKCKNMKYDLILYGYKGLFEGIIKYDAKCLFTVFVGYYIKWSMYKCLTDNHVISTIPKHERRRSISNRKYVYHEEKRYLSGYDYLKSTNDVCYIHNYHEYEYMWKKIHLLDPFIIRIFHYKFDFYFNKIRTNIEIAELMCCSEEYVRKNIKRYILKLAY